MLKTPRFLPRCGTSLCALILSLTACAGGQHSQSLDHSTTRALRAALAEPTLHSVANSGIGERLKGSLSNGVIRGDTSCRYGDFGCNMCVENVARAFKRLGSDRHHRHSFQFHPGKRSENGFDPRFFPAGGHVQSVQRLSGVDNDNWMVFSVSSGYRSTGALYLVRFPFESEGNAWKWSRNRQGQTNSATHIVIPTSNNQYHSYHPGGMQAAGGMLAVANEGDFRGIYGTRPDHAVITFYDLREPWRYKEIHPIAYLTLDGSHGELWSEERARVSLVAWTRTSDQRFFVFVGGDRSAASGWFFLSNQDRLDQHTTWKLVDRWDHREQRKSDRWQEWENINFITECGTGQLFAVTAGTLNNHLFLYRLEETKKPRGDQHNFEFRLIAQHRLKASGIFNATGVSTRWGTGVHVTAEGRLSLYVTARGTPYFSEDFSALRIDEFRSKGKPSKPASDATNLRHVKR